MGELETQWWRTYHVALGAVLSRPTVVSRPTASNGKRIYTVDSPEEGHAFATKSATLAHGPLDECRHKDLRQAAGMEPR
jgi:hypothetical protein